MAVKKSPFSKSNAPVPVPTFDPNASSWGSFSSAPVGGGASAGLDLTTPISGGGSKSTGTVRKTSFQEEQKELNKSLRTLQSRIARGTGDYETLVAQAQAIAEGKKPESQGLFGKLLGIGKRVVLDPFGIAETSKGPLGEAVLGTPSRAVQSFVDYAIATPATNILQFTWGGKDWKDLKWDDPKYAYNRTFDPNWSIMSEPEYQTGNKWVDGTAGLAISIFADPWTYSGVGATKWAGRAGREALALKFGTEKMLAKYPELAGKLDDIVRYGEWAIPKNIRDAEGVESGLRFAGKLIKGTEDVIEPVARTIGGTRAKLGDAFYKAEPIVMSGLVPKSTRAGVAYGIGRGLKKSDEEVLTRIAGTSAQRYAKGATLVDYKKSVAAVVDDIKAARKNPFYERAYSLVEDPVKLEAARNSTDADMQALSMFADRIAAWEKQLVESVNAERKAFAEAYGLDVNEINILDDYLHHRMTKEAREWITKNPKGRMWKPEYLTLDDLTGEIGAARYRKLRPGEEFMGEVLQKGTIEEINEISMRNAGVKWFETDIGSIADSYAYSMAKAKGRVAWSKRMMDFGPQYIKPLIDEAVPDEKLANTLNRAYERLLGEADDIRKRVSIRMDDIKNLGRRSRSLATAALNKNYSAQKRTQAELRKSLAELDKVVEELVAAQKEAATKSSAERGAFNEAFSALLGFRNRLHAAITRGEDAKFAVTEELTKVYAQVFPTKRNIPSNPEVMAEEILRRQGVKTSREMVEAKARERALVKQIDELADLPEQEEFRNALIDELESIQQDVDGFTKMADVRLEASYAPDGFVYGTIDDVVPIPPEQAIQPYKILRSYRTEVLEDPEAIAIFAPAERSLIDMRNPEDFRSVFNSEDTTGVIVNAMDEVGLNGNGFALELQNYRKTGQIDPMFEELYPAQAGLIRKFDELGMKPADDGFIPHSELVGDLEELENLFIGVASELNLEDADLVGQQLMDEMLGGIMFFNQERGILVPAEFVDRGMDFGDDAYAVLMPTSYGNKQPRTGGAAYTTDEVQSVADNRFVQRVLAGDYESASLEAQTTFDTLSDNLMNTELDMAARQALEEELGVARRRRAGLQGAATRRTRKAEAAIEQYRKTGTVTVYLDGKRLTLTPEQAKARVAKIDLQYSKGEKKLEQMTRRIEAELGIPNLLKRQAKLEERIGMLFNQAEVLKQWDETTGELYRNEIDNLNTLLKFRPSKGAAGMQTVAWQRKVDRAVQSIGLLDEVTGEAYRRVTTQLHADEARLAWLESAELPSSEAILKMVKSGKWGGTIRKTTEKGWEAISGLGVQVPEELLSIWKPNVARLAEDPNIFKRVLDGYDWYLRFFKTYATSSLGFSVRNAMSATFMNYVAGVETRSIVDGAKAAMAIQKYGPEKWIDNLGLNASQKEMYRRAWEATEATGRGFGDELAMPVVNGGLAEKIINNRYTRFFGRINDFTERAVRLPMALDSMNRGFSFDETVARISRYHFDYSDLSQLDEVAKRFVPFWIWTSRNVPLQITSMLTRPGAYITYDKIQEAAPPDTDLFMPQWLSSMQPIGLGGKNVLAFDLPFGRLEQSTRNILSLEGLLAQSSPLVKLPFELTVADKQVGLGVPFTDKWEKARGVDKAVAALANALGLEGIAVDTPEGLMINPKAPYALATLLPPVAKAERLSGGLLGGKANYADRQLASLLNEIGIPFRDVEPYERGEAINRQMQLKDFAKKLERKGTIRKKDD